MIIISYHHPLNPTSINIQQSQGQLSNPTTKNTSSTTKMINHIIKTVNKTASMTNFNFSQIYQYYQSCNMLLRGSTRRMMFGTIKKISDSDQLTTQEMQELLGHKLVNKNEKQSKPNLNKTTASANANSARQMTATAINLDQKSILQKHKQYFYGLMPLKNQNYPECIDPQQIIIQQTPNQNIFKVLQLPINCSFADYTTALRKFHSESQLYGDETQQPIIQSKSLQFYPLLQFESEYLKLAKERHLVNISIPGTIQCEDFRNFLQLRPIQQFRHTPLVPISDSYMKKHKEMLQAYHRRQFIFELSTQKMINWVLVAMSVAVGSYMIYMILQKEEERTVNFSRLKHQRMMGESSEKPVFKIG